MNQNSNYLTTAKHIKRKKQIVEKTLESLALVCFGIQIQKFNTWSEVGHRVMVLSIAQSCLFVTHVSNGFMQNLSETSIDSISHQFYAIVAFSKVHISNQGNGYVEFYKKNLGFYVFPLKNML